MDDGAGLADQILQVARGALGGQRSAVSRPRAGKFATSMTPIFSVGGYRICRPLAFRAAGSTLEVASYVITRIVPYLTAEMLAKKQGIVKAQSVQGLFHLGSPVEPRLQFHYIIDESAV